MYLTVSDMKKLDRALYMAFQPKIFDKLTTDQRQAVIEADMVIMRLYKKRKISNKETNKKIKEKRKTNPNYGRSKREIQKHEEAIRKREARKALKEYTGKQEIQSMYPSQIILNNTCYHCNYFRLLDETGKGHCLHSDTRCGIFHSLDLACEHFEQEIVENVCTKHCEDCDNYYNVDGCANYQICKHPDNNMYLIEGTYEACVKFQPKTN